MVTITEAAFPRWQPSELMDGHSLVWRGRPCCEGAAARQTIVIAIVTRIVVVPTHCTMSQI